MSTLKEKAKKILKEIEESDEDDNLESLYIEELQDITQDLTIRIDDLEEALKKVNSKLKKTISLFTKMDDDIECTPTKKSKV